MEPVAGVLDSRKVMVLEAFADTIIPGERRGPDDRAVAGAAEGGGAVAAGAVELMMSAEGGLEGMLDDLVEALDDHAARYAGDAGIVLDRAAAPFVALPFDGRTALAAILMAPEHPEREMWVALAMFSVMAWDTGASMHTTEALAAGHPGLVAMGFSPPDPDGLWRFPEFSYRRQLAAIHPHTTPLGDPA